MVLVDYSDSDSETETVQQKKLAPSAAATSKKPFQKLLDRSSGAGKIVINLPAASATTDAAVEDSQPPAKRVKTAGGSRFSSLGSFLPPPKKTATSAPAAPGRKQGVVPAPGVHLRTAAEPAFIRGCHGDDTADVDGDASACSSSGLNLPAPNSKGPAGPSIPEGQKPEEEVKLVGKPLMFKPLSVARKKAPAKAKKKDLAAVVTPPMPGVAASQTSFTAPPAASATTESPEFPPKKKVSLFSIGDDEPAPTTSVTTAQTGTYEPMFTSVPEPDQEDDEESAVTSTYPTYQQQQQQQSSVPSQHHQDLSSLASTLTPAARRELFGRSTTTTTSSYSSVLPPNAKVIEFDMEREYEHNEAVRASGAQQAYNPVRSIAPGKHSLRQVVNMAQSNQGALEESFARAKSNKKDAAGRYGW
ncbi:hypothetical protein N657DRAFT_656149 [Parathielavia appendiculata]|uniref:Uncharacterized protein n=1 Tax=Parathielavia appendiculata TaxID=2587402 RepID=A0AAN6U091_9PEZI|nr:hypothetical protein N657DRAFT_656149 [Parathielavia appendiculata]